MADYAVNCPKLPWMIDYFSTMEGQVPKEQLGAVYDETRTDYLSKLNFESERARKRLTSLICTIGPKSSTVKELESLIAAGMCVARIKTSFFKRPQCEEVVDNIRAAADEFSRKMGSMYPVAIAFDIAAPGIRTGSLEDKSSSHLQLEQGQSTAVTSDPTYEEHVTKDVIYVDYPRINETIEPGDRLFVGSEVALSALEIVGSFVRCIVEHAGDIGSHDTVTLEDSIVSTMSYVPEKDVRFAVEQKVDMIIVSGIRDRNNILAIRRLLGEKGQCMQIISKIGNAESVKNIKELIEVSDGIMISRSNLLYGIPSEKLFLVQKMIVASCNKAGKPVIIAPQILESMSSHTKPTKAEIMDVTNAILDGADGLVLSGETAIGENPTKALEVLGDMCQEAECAIHQGQVFQDLTKENPWPYEPIYALAISAVEASMKTNAACIVLVTTSGRTAEIIARYRPRCPIVAITRFARVARKLRMFRAVEPIHYVAKPMLEWAEDVRKRIQFGISYGKQRNFIRAADTIVVLSGTRSGSGFTNSMTLYYASEFDTIPNVLL